MPHTYDKNVANENTLKSAATCTAAAVYYKSCECGAISTEDTFVDGEPLPHTYDKEVVKPSYLKAEATCTSAAVYYKSCACGHYITGGETFEYGPMADHIYSNEHVIDAAIKEEATCTLPTLYYKSCYCGAISTDDKDVFYSGSKKPHEYNKEVVSEDTLLRPATCNDPATYLKSCVCGAISLNETFAYGPTLVHEYAEVSSTEATCEAAATKTYKCNACGDEYTDEIGSALGHKIDTSNPIENQVSTCEYQLVYICQRNGCGQETVGESVYNHEYIAAITTPATCQANGEKTLTCVCGDTMTEVIPSDSTGHAWVKGDVVGNVREDACSYCGATKSVTVYEGTSTDSTNANNFKDVEIELNDANISLDDGVIDALGGKDVTLSADKVEGGDRENLGLSDEELAQVGDNPIFNFTISDGEGNISQFGEDNYVTITLPYTLADGEDVDSIAVWFINDKGELESIKAIYNNGYVTFKTNHFSYYTVTRLTPAQRCELYGHSYACQHVEGSCTSDTYDLYVCVRCHDKYIDEKTYIKADGHDYVEERVEPTCTASGHITTKCKDCDSYYTTKLNATGHSWVAGETKAPTCIESGYVKYTCAKCGDEYTAISPKVAHTYVAITVAPTCSDQGYTSYTCSVCGDEYRENYVDALGHNFDHGNWEWLDDLSGATYVAICSNDPTHTDRATAEITVAVVKSPCSDFTKTIYTAKATYAGNEYTDEKVVETGTVNHQFSSEWKTDDKQHWQECICGEKTNVADHVFQNDTQTIAPTCSTTGESVAYCECGKEKVTVIPATGEHNYQNGFCVDCGAEFIDTYYLNLINSWKDIDGIAVRLENLSFVMNYADDSVLGGWKLIGSIKQVDVAELALFVKDGEIGGAARGNIVIYNGPISNANAVYNFKAVIDGGFVYITLLFF